MAHTPEDPLMLATRQAISLSIGAEGLSRRLARAHADFTQMDEKVRQLEETLKLLEPLWDIGTANTVLCPHCRKSFYQPSPSPEKDGSPDQKPRNSSELHDALNTLGGSFL